MSELTVQELTVHISGRDFKKELGLLGKNSVMLAEVDAKDYGQVIDSSIDLLVSQKKLSMVYVSLNKPAKTIMNYFNEKHVDFSNVFFIDGVSGETVDDEDKNCVVLTGPSSLTELSVQVSSAMERPNVDFIFFDAISTLLIYNSQKRCMQFSYYLMKMLRTYKVSALLIFVKSSLESEMFNYITPLADKSIRL